MTLDTQEVEEAIEEDEEEDDRVEWPPFDGDGYAPKEPHALGERPLEAIGEEGSTAAISSGRRRCC